MGANLHSCTNRKMELLPLGVGGIKFCSLGVSADPSGPSLSSSTVMRSMSPELTSSANPRVSDEKRRKNYQWCSSILFDLKVLFIHYNFLTMFLNVKNTWKTGNHENPNGYAFNKDVREERL